MECCGRLVYVQCNNSTNGIGNQILFFLPPLQKEPAVLGSQPAPLSALQCALRQLSHVVGPCFCAAPQSFCIAAVHWFAGPGAGAGAGAGGLGLGPLPHSHHVAPLLEILVQPGQQTSQS